ncbi:MAG: TonB-dependent receptor [Vicinamibacterales bacterium]|nr:TonB-dependent receptor [Vicinamibacterales bacterium]
MQSFVRTVATVAALLLFVVGAAAQGVQTGDLTGVVRASDGTRIPGATVTVTSPALPGARSTVTDVAGAYIVRALPPGEYTVRVALAELSAPDQVVTVPLGAVAILDAVLRPVTASEAVTVVASRPSVLNRPSAGLNLPGADVDRLPMGRTPSLIAEMAPGLTANTPNVNQIAASGAFAYDSLFLVDGVDVNDNLFGRPDDLFIEDAVEETEVQTSAMSAEYGRFSGAVVNVVTRRGGDLFAGSLRANLSNAAWSTETPFEKTAGLERPSHIDRHYEATLGGPVLRERLWFFTAGRMQASDTTAALPATGAPFETTTDATRLEVKLTGSPWPNQTLQAQYTGRQQSTRQPSLPFTIDPNAGDDTEQPGTLFVGRWSGVVSNQFFATAQYSQKTNHPRFGGTSTAFADSPMLTIGRVAPRSQHFNAPYFDRTDPEDRDNRQFTGSVAYFASSPSWGTHDVKAGVEHFTSVFRGGNSQSATGFIVNTDYAIAGGAPVVGADGRLVPVWIPGGTTLTQSVATRGAQMDITTLSFFVQDRWTPMSRLTLDLGLRVEHASSTATGDAPGISASTWVPRLGATVDLDGRGRTVLNASYGHYAGRYSSYQFGRNTPVGNAARVGYGYVGPAGQGRDFAPAANLANYVVIGGVFPTANVFLDEDLRTPVTREVTLSLGREIGQGVVRGTYVWRTATGLIESFIDRPTADGRTTVVQNGVTFGTFDNIYYRNSDEPSRDYQAVIVAGSQRLTSRWQVEGQWTVQLRNHGTFEGEAANQPGIGSVIGDYPEVFTAARNNPSGRLDEFQRHKVRLWTIYRMDLGRVGQVDVAQLWRYDSGRTYSLVANAVPVTAAQRALNPGYVSLPSTQALFFGERGSETFPGYGLVDLGVTYRVPVWRTAGPWVKVEVLNALNNQKAIAWDTTIAPDAASPLDASGLPTGYVTGPRYGQATSTAHYPRPRGGLTGGRTFLVAAGVRF